MHRLQRADYNDVQEKRHRGRVLPMAHAKRNKETNGPNPNNSINKKKLLLNYIPITEIIMKNAALI